MGLPGRDTNKRTDRLPRPPSNNVWILRGGGRSQCTRGETEADNPKTKTEREREGARADTVVDIGFSCERRRNGPSLVWFEWSRQESHIMAD